MPKSKDRVAQQCTGEGLAPRALAPLLEGLIPLELGGDGHARLRDLDARTAEGLPPERRDALRKLVRQTVHERMGRFPREILDHPLPSPAVVLRTLSLDWRISDCLRRLLPILPTDTSWTIRRYLSISRFRAAFLLEVLVRLEAHQDRGAPRVAQMSSVDPFDEGLVLARWLRHLKSRLPLTESEAHRALARMGFQDPDASVSELARRAEEHGLVVPFRVVRQRGCIFVVAPEQAAGVTALTTAAARAIQHWGLASVREIVKHVRVVHGHGPGHGPPPARAPGSTGARRSRTTNANRIVDGKLARTVLSSLPQFSWLDRKLGWFWFRDCPNRLLRALGKIFSVTTSVKLDVLLAAIFRAEAQAGGPRPSRRALESACAQLPGCRLDGDDVRMEAALYRAEWLSPTELSLVDLLEKSGGAASTTAIQRMALACGIAPGTFWRTVRASPVVLTLPAATLMLVR